MWGCGTQPPPRKTVLSPALPAVIHSGDYFLFESDSEEEEEALPEDPRPSAQSAFQVRWEGPLPCPAYRPQGLRSPAWGRTRTLWPACPDTFRPPEPSRQMGKQL